MTEKSIAGLLVALLVLSAVALGQEYQTPFPQSANPASRNGTAEQLSSSSARELPSSMAANQSTIDEQMSPASAFIGSPFPQAANPASRTGRSETASALDDRHDSGSPFPSAANPARR